MFNSSPSPDKVACGKDDWLFLTGEFYGISQDLSRENLYSKKELEQQVLEWENRKSELEKKNIKYYKAFWPDKYYIYPECLPISLKIISRDTNAKCDQAIQYLDRKNSSIKIIDVRNELFEEKKRNQVYFKSDSHWNDYGAFVAYTKLMTVLSKDFENLNPFALDDFSITMQKPSLEGDLSTIIKVKSYEKEPVFKLKKDMSPAEKLSVEGYPKKTFIYKNVNATSKLKALIYRDSYTNALIPFIMRHFNEVVFIWDTDYSMDMVEKVKPDIVIECYASRYFR